MNTNETRPARGAEPALRRRVPLHVLLPSAIALAVGGVLLQSILRTCAPIARVEVAPAVHLVGQEGAGASVDSPARVQAAGWLEAEPYAHACSALTDGVIREVLVLEGDRVERGQAVANLVDEDARLALARAESDLALARAEVARAEAALRAAQDAWDNPIELDRAVAVGGARLREAEAERLRLPSLIESEVATLERLQAELDLTSKARAGGAATGIEVTVLAKQVAAQESSVRALRTSEVVLDARIDRLRAELDAARRRATLRIEDRRMLDEASALRDAALARADAAEALRDEAALRVERMTVRSPIDGVVQRRLRSPGDKVVFGADDPASSQVVRVYDPSRLQVRVDVPLADAAGVREGQACEIVAEVLPGALFRGVVTRITHEADIQKNTLQVKVRVLEPSPVLRPEMLARVIFLDDTAPGPASRSPAPGGEASDSVLVRSEAVRDDGAGGAVVWVVRQRRGMIGRARRVAVRVGDRRDRWARVSGALRPGDLVVRSPAGLREGQRVRMTPRGAPA